MNIKDLKELVPFKIELISSAKTRLLNELQIGEYYKEQGEYNSYQYHVSCEQHTDGRYLIHLSSGGYKGKIESSFLFTWRDKMPIVYTPSIFRQMSGKNKGEPIYFNFYEAWKKFGDTKEFITESMKNEKRWFLPSYLNKTFYK